MCAFVCAHIVKWIHIYICVYLCVCTHYIRWLDGKYDSGGRRKKNFYILPFKINSFGKMCTYTFCSTVVRADVKAYPSAKLMMMMRKRKIMKYIHTHTARTDFVVYVVYTCLWIDSDAFTPKYRAVTFTIAESINALRSLAPFILP